MNGARAVAHRVASSAEWQAYDAAPVFSMDACGNRGRLGRPRPERVRVKGRRGQILKTVQRLFFPNRSVRVFGAAQLESNLFFGRDEGSALSWKKKESPPLFFARWSSLRLLRVGALCGARRPRARDRLRATAVASSVGCSVALDRFATRPWNGGRVRSRFQ